MGGARGRGGWAWGAPGASGGGGGVARGPGGWALGAPGLAGGGRGVGGLDPEEASLSAARGLQRQDLCAPLQGAGREPRVWGVLCRTCGSSRRPWRFTWESSTSG